MSIVRRAKPFGRGCSKALRWHSAILPMKISDVRYDLTSGRAKPFGPARPARRPPMQSA